MSSISPPATSATRASFTEWLIRHRHQLRGLSVPDMIRRSAVPISRPAAYRCAMAVGIRGRRFNRTRYAAFWKGLNWDLPDLLLAQIWRVDRGNLRRRRQRLNKGAPRFGVTRGRDEPSLAAAVRREELKSANYDGPRPC